METHHFKRQSNTLILALMSLAIALLSGCASTPDIKPAVQTPAPGQSRSAIVNYALSLQGVPYRYGKDSPEEGFDCSGFVRHVYQKQGIRLPRTTKAMALALPPVSMDEVHSGDLVFFDTNGRAYSHVGIYIEDDQFIHAPSKRTGRVLVSNLKTPYWQKHYSGVRRPQ
ncbi:MAG: NlpC/P60 family protein [Methylococcales bacterium]|nr:NlpC/P60 family protein [Methylococcales bacterium]